GHSTPLTCARSQQLWRCSLFVSLLRRALFFFSSRRRHTRSVSAFLLNRSSDLYHQLYRLSRNCSKYRQQLYQYHEKYQPHQKQHQERFSRNAETDLVCRLLLEKKKTSISQAKESAGLIAIETTIMATPTPDPSGDSIA